jgi:hypothetical protein
MARFDSIFSVAPHRTVLASLLFFLSASSALLCAPYAQSIRGRFAVSAAARIVVG